MTEDEQFTEELSELVGDIAVALRRFLNIGVDHADDVIKKTWKDLTKRVCKLAQES